MFIRSPLHKVYSKFLVEGHEGHKAKNHSIIPLRVLTCVLTLFNVLTSQDAIFVPGQRSKVTKLKIEENTSVGKLVEPFRIW